jgi:hypothetical protein
MPVSKEALQSIDRFIKVAKELAENPALAEREYAEAAFDVSRIAYRLLIATENMARWRDEFLYFNFHGPDAHGRFRELAKRFNTAKNGPEIRAMKFRCGEILFIYNSRLRDHLTDVFTGDQDGAATAKRSFEALGSADGSMVDFIYYEVVGSIDAFVTQVETRAGPSNLNPAESARLAFKVDAAPLSKRLERFAIELSDLVLQFAVLAGRPPEFTLDAP